MKNGSNRRQDIQPMMILTIDIGNGNVDKLQLYDLNNIEQETYDFCVKNKLDFNTMQEINTQIQNVLKDKQLEEEQEINNVFQEIKEEEDEKITENNINEIKEQESIIKDAEIVKADGKSSAEGRTKHSGRGLGVAAIIIAVITLLLTIGNRSIFR